MTADAAWPVTPRAQGQSTFSGRSGPAGFHTDAQYRANPEDYVCLFAVRPAADGGGSTLLLPFHAALEAIRERRDGGMLLAAMQRPGWRWRVPAESADGPHCAFPASVLDGCGRIRWRADNLDALPTGAPAGAAGRIDEAFDAADGRVRLHLKGGDLLVLDNHRVLHAPTDFRDRRRLLLRVRLWETLY